MKRNAFEVVAISLDPRVLTTFHGKCKVLRSNYFGKPSHRFFGIHFKVLIYEPLVVY